LLMYNTPTRDDIDSAQSSLMRHIPRVPSSGTILSADQGYDTEIKKSD